MKNKKTPIILTITLLLLLAACQPLTPEENPLTGRTIQATSAEEKTVTSPPINIEVKDSDEEPEEIELPSLMGWGSETKGAWGHPDVVAGIMEPKIVRVTSLGNGLEPGTIRWAFSYRATVHDSSGVTYLGDNTYRLRFIETLDSQGNNHLYEEGDRMMSTRSDYESHIRILEIHSNHFVTVEHLSGNPPVESVNGGSLRYVRNEPEIIVFEVGGVISLGSSVNLGINSPYKTILGQTASYPGITITNLNSIRVQDTHDVIIQHLKVRPGQHNRIENYENDGIVVANSRNIVVDRNSFTWAIDQQMTIRGSSPSGATHEEIREITSQNVTFSNNIIAEGLHNSSHPKGPHSKCVLVAARAWRFSLIRNLMAHCDSRNPYLGSASDASIINNIMYNWGDGATSAGWRTPSDPIDAPTHVDLISNYHQAGPDSTMDNIRRSPFRTTSGGSNFMLYHNGNIGYWPDGTHYIMEGGWGNQGPTHYFTGPEPTIVSQPQEIVTSPDIIADPDKYILSIQELLDYLPEHVGARPWDRDSVDTRIVQETMLGINELQHTGGIIDHEDDRGGVPSFTPTSRDFNIDEWFWWDGGIGDNANRVLLNKETNNYYHKNDKKP